MKKSRYFKRLTSLGIAVALLLLSSANICVTATPVTVASSMLETFDDGSYDTAGVEGTTLFTGTSSTQDFDIGSYLHLSINGVGTKVEIVTDPVTSSKAMKITHPGSGTIQIYNYYSGNSKTSTKIAKMIKTGCKVRIASQKDTAITRFNRVDSAASNVAGCAIWNKKFCGYGTSVVEIPGAATISSDSYVSTSVTYNPTTKKAVRQTGNAVRVDTETTTQTQYNRTWYRFEAPGSNYTSTQWKGADANTTEIWIDDFFFETYEYEPQISVAGKAGVYKNNSSYTSTALTDIPLNAPIDVRFTGDCGDSAVSTSSYTLKDSSNNDVAFTVERFTGNIVTILPENQIGGETYTFTALAGIVSAENAAIDTRTARSVTYTTVTNGRTFRGFVESENFNSIAETTYTDTTPSSGFLGGKINILQNVANESIGVATDPATGDKALRIYINNHNSAGKYLWVLPEVYQSGMFVTTFDVRLASAYFADNGYFMSFGNVTATDGRSGGWSNRMKSGNYWSFKDSNSTDQWTSTSNATANVYFPAMMSIDFDSTTFSGQVYRKYGTNTQSLISKNTSFASASNCDNLKYIHLATLKKTNSGAAASEIYIDNLRVARYDIIRNFEVDNTAISDNDVQGTLHNNTESSSSYIAIAAQFDNSGNITGLNSQNGTISAGSTAALDIDFTGAGTIYNLFIWEGVNTLIPLTKKITIVP